VGYQARIKGYLQAIHAVVTATEPLRHNKPPTQIQPDNIALWHLITADATRLSSEYNSAEAAYHAAMAKQGLKSDLGNRFLKALTTVQELLNSLRNARP